MAKTNIKNTAPGARGIYTDDGQLVMLEPGESRSLDVNAAELKDAKASGHFKIGGQAADDADDADDEAGEESIGALKKADLVAIAEAEGVAIETDDNRADLIRKIEEAREEKA